VDVDVDVNVDVNVDVDVDEIRMVVMETQSIARCRKIARDQR